MTRETGSELQAIAVGAVRPTHGLVRGLMFAAARSFWRRAD